MQKDGGEEYLGIQNHNTIPPYIQQSPWFEALGLWEL